MFAFTKNSEDDIIRFAQRAEMHIYYDGEIAQ